MHTRRRQLPQVPLNRSSNNRLMPGHPQHLQSVDAVAIRTGDHAAQENVQAFRSFYLRCETADAKNARRIPPVAITPTIEIDLLSESRAAIANAELSRPIAGCARPGLMAQIIQFIADDRYASRIGMLAEYVNHHIREERRNSFRRRGWAGHDEIGSRMFARRLDLGARSRDG